MSTPINAAGTRPKTERAEKPAHVGNAVEPAEAPFLGQALQRGARVGDRHETTSRFRHRRRHSFHRIAKSDSISIVVPDLWRPDQGAVEVEMGEQLGLSGWAE
jgi:hypothetical protein